MNIFKGPEDLQCNTVQGILGEAITYSWHKNLLKDPIDTMMKMMDILIDEPGQSKAHDVKSNFKPLNGGMFVSFFPLGCVANKNKEDHWNIYSETH